MECAGPKLFAWTLALGLTLVLVALLIATGESIRHAEIASPVPHAVEPDLPLQDPPADNMYHDPGLAAWPTP